MAKKYGPIPLELKNKQIEAMRWLAKNGLSAEEIRTLRWGCVDESAKQITIKRDFLSVRYDLETQVIYKKVREGRETKLSFAGQSVEWFFAKSQTPSMFWVFVREYPRNWRKNKHLNSLYSPQEIQGWIKDLPGLENKSTNVLTLPAEFGKMKVVKMNITKLKT